MAWVTRPERPKGAKDEVKQLYKYRFLQLLQLSFQVESFDLVKCLDEEAALCTILQQAAAGATGANQAISLEIGANQAKDLIGGQNYSGAWTLCHIYSSFYGTCKCERGALILEIQ